MRLVSLPRTRPERWTAGWEVEEDELEEIRFFLSSTVASTRAFATMAFRRVSRESFSLRAEATRSFRRRSSPSPSFSVPQSS